MLSWLIPGLWEGIQWSWHLDSDKQTDHSLEKIKKCHEQAGGTRLRNKMEKGLCEKS